LLDTASNDLFKNNNIFIETNVVNNLYCSNKHNQLHQKNKRYSDRIFKLQKSFLRKRSLLNDNQFKLLQNKIMNKSNKITKKELVSLIREAIDEYRTKGALGKKNPARGTPVKTGAKKVNTVEVYFQDAAGNMKPVTGGLNSISGMKFDFITSTWPRTKSFLEKELMVNLGDVALSARIGQSVYDELENAKMNELDDLLTVNNNVIVFYLENNELKARTEGSVNEELVGNQKVLDKTGDGKLTAKDFELLRKSKK
jgi:hypothetical protein